MTVSQPTLFNTPLLHCNRFLQSSRNLSSIDQRLSFSFEVCTGPLSSVGVNETAVGTVGAMFFESTYVVFNMGAEPSISFSVWNATAEDYGL